MKPCSLQIGMAEQKINPPLGTALAGYHFPERISFSVQDDLMVRAVVFDDGKETAALIASDLISLSTGVVSAIRMQIEQQTGIPSQNIMVTATHTHSAPTARFMRHWGKVSPAYVRSLLPLFAGTVKKACDEKKKVKFVSIPALFPASA